MKNITESPWQIVQEKPIYQNNWISLTEYDVINPSGNAGIYGVVNFKALAVGAIPMDNDLNIWLVGQYRFPLNEYSWEIPEGGCPFTEEPIAAAARELKEETGIVAKQYQHLVTMHLSNSVTNEKSVVYLATGLSFEEAAPEETEDLVIKKLHLFDAIKMIDKGEITDSMSVAGLQQLYIRYLSNTL